jgi:23S rRNA (pseudouridine1915-N3)-methyltransferase
MKVKLLFLGKTTETWLQTGIKDYTERLKRYIQLEIVEVPSIRNVSSRSLQDQKEMEAAAIRRRCATGDILILLDESGKEMRSVDFARFLNLRFTGTGKWLVFAIGGPYGFSDTLRKEAAFLISLSRMTFSHQIVRLLFIEQLYRAMTILRNESYHHE